MRTLEELPHDLILADLTVFPIGKFWFIKPRVGILEPATAW